MGAADGTGAAASFNRPQGITSDGLNLYVVDSGSDTIRQIVIATGVVSTLAGTAGTAGAADGTGTAASFNYPRGITADGINLYVADTYNHTIRQIVIATGVVSTLAGTAGVFGLADGVGTTALFSSPQGITSDGSSLYVVDSGNNIIRKIQ
jgi:sugar lactone lactonase YvrE